MRKLLNALTALAIVAAATTGSAVVSSSPAEANIWKGPVVVKWPNGKTYRCHKTPTGQTSCTQI